MPDPDHPEPADPEPADPEPDDRLVDAGQARPDGEDPPEGRAWVPV